MLVNKQSLQLRISEADVLSGELNMPEQAAGIVLFAHGSGSSRHSPRNQFVAEVLNEKGFATFLVDLLSAREDGIDVRTAQFRFDISLLGKRLVSLIDWLKQNHETKELPLGLFGASTGSAAAIIAAAARPQHAMALVSRGGRPDLAGRALSQMNAPTLLLVGEYDQPVIELHQQALVQLRCQHKITIVPKATHLFEEPGALERVADAAADWFGLFLVPPGLQYMNASVTPV
jgi:putative phosphoribosyl transferase